MGEVKVAERQCARVGERGRERKSVRAREKARASE